MPSVNRNAPTTRDAVAADSTRDTSGPAAAPAEGWRSGTTTTTAPARAQRGTARASLGATMAAGGNRSIEMRMKKHADSIEKTGVGVYFGDHSSFKTMSLDERTKWISDNAKPDSTPPSPSSMRQSSCIEWAAENVGAAYAAAGKSGRWAEILSIVTANGSRGTVLAQELKKDGWQSIYWNPDTKHPNDGENEHPYSAAVAARGGGYYGIPVDAMVVNYRPTEGQGTTLDMSGVEKLRKVPFFFGLAKGGRHTFVGRDGQVNEFHWSSMPDDKGAIEQTPLEQFGWNSGVIMVPPGTWPTGR